MYGPHAGSKRQARILALEARQVAAMKRRLGRIYELAQSIRDEAHLDQILADIDDDTLRAETRTVIEPFLSFPRKSIVLTDDPHVLHVVEH